MKPVSTVRELIRQMPKAELHLHLEGAFTFDVLFNLIQKYGGDPSIRSIGDLEKRFVFTDFPHFIETWFWKNGFFREVKDFEISTYHTLECLHRQNVCYVEAFYSPWDFTPNGLSVEAITEATLNAVHRARDDYGIECKLIADLSRDHGWETAIARFQQVIPYRDHGVIGIGLGGSEQAYPPGPFAQVYRYARDLGFHLVAHAGEAAGPESIWEAVEQLCVERIGHGVRAIEDDALMDRLAKERIPLEVCITSNLKTGVYPALAAHPIRSLLERGLFITINSDDPTMFGTTLTDEYLLLYEKLNFPIETIRQLSLNAIRASFLSEEEKTVFLKKFSSHAA